MIIGAATIVFFFHNGARRTKFLTFTVVWRVIAAQGFPWE